MEQRKGGIYVSPVERESRERKELAMTEEGRKNTSGSSSSSSLHFHASSKRVWLICRQHIWPFVSNSIV